MNLKWISRSIWNISDPSIIAGDDSFLIQNFASQNLIK